MSAIKKYAIQKSNYLNPPVSIDQWNSIISQHSAISELKCVYMLFNGDKHLDEEGVFNYQKMVPHSFLSDATILPVEVLTKDVEHMVDVWEQVEETSDVGDGVYPLRQFYPFISTGMGRGIGPIYAGNPKYIGSVIEYDYEAGEFRVWAKNLSAFIDAFFNFSIDRYTPTNDFEKDESEYIFTEDDKAYLAKWSEVVYPVVGEDFIDVSELLKSE